MHTIDAEVRTMPLSRTRYVLPGTKQEACRVAAVKFREKFLLGPNIHVDTRVVVANVKLDEVKA